jgi:hypothetical protein
MRVAAAFLCLAVFVSGAPVRAEDPVGTVICKFPEAAFDCAQGRCRSTDAAANREMKLDFAAKKLCVVRDADCTDATTIEQAFVDDTKTIVATITSNGSTFLFRIGPNLDASIVVALGVDRVVVALKSTCRRP